MLLHDDPEVGHGGEYALVYLAPLLSIQDQEPIQGKSTRVESACRARL